MTKITANNIQSGAITLDKLDSSVASGVSSADSANTAATIAFSLAAAAFAAANDVSSFLANVGVPPLITSIQITDSSYNVLDDTAANTTGGYIVITGSGFTNTSIVIIGSTTVTSVTYVDPTTLRAQTPAITAGSWPVYVVNPDGTTAIKSNGLTTSSFPAWSTESTLTSQVSGIPFAIPLSASADSTITYANTTILPTGTTLAANGYFSGNVSVGTSTNYTFTVKATDSENQDALRDFNLTVSAAVGPGQVGFTTTTAWTVPAGVTSISAVIIGGGGGGCKSVSAGGGGSGGDLRYVNNLPVTPGHTLTVFVGTGGVAAATGGDGGQTYITNNAGAIVVSAAGGGGGTTFTARAKNGTTTAAGAGPNGGTIGGGLGGTGGQGQGSVNAGGGGGAGGYTGNGGNGATAANATNGAAGSGGGGGGGGAASSGGRGGNGGGTGLNGLGSNGAGGTYNGGGTGQGGYGGVGSGITGQSLSTTLGAGGCGDDNGSTALNGDQGAARIIWPGNVRQFPSTRCTDE